tara:strand:- start:5131 stop:6297 length:1167 start_codon:yes stop_codon:yes gene_type:complete
MNALQTVHKISQIDNKKTGMPGNLETQKIIKNYLSPYGNLSEENYPITVYSRNKGIIKRGDLKLEGYLHDYTGFNKKRELKGEIIKVGKIWELDLLLKKPKGKIIMCKSSIFIHRIMQIQKAIRKGALAIIIVSPFEKEIVYGTGTSYLNNPIRIPAVSITKDQARKIKNKRIYSIEIDYKEKRILGENIIFEFGETKYPTIVIGAHYDGWSYSAQDNVISLYFIFKLIESLKDKPSRFNYKFIFFDSEELGMVGSYNHLKKNKELNYKAYINLDSIIPSKGLSLRIIIYSKNIKHSIPSLKCILNGYIPIPLGFFYKPPRYCFPSDSHHFYLNNIPTMTTFSSGKFYHTKKDIFKTLNLKKIKKIKKILNKILHNIEDDIRKNQTPL